MKRVALTLAIITIVIYVLLILVPIDPDEQRPGTSLSGAVNPATEIDWSFLPSRSLVYVQSNTWYGIPHSVTTTSFVDDGVLYIPCARCDTKRWPKLVAADPNVFVKVGGELFQRRAVLIEDTSTKRRILAERHSEVWLYRMDAPD